MAVTTCRHYRYQIPREDADELRAVDPQACEVCDARGSKFQSITWTPVRIRSKRNYATGWLRSWAVQFVAWLQMHRLPAVGSAPRAH